MTFGRTVLEFVRTNIALANPRSLGHLKSIIGDANFRSHLTLWSQSPDLTISVVCVSSFLSARLQDVEPIASVVLACPSLVRLVMPIHNINLEPGKEDCSYIFPEFVTGRSMWPFPSA